MKKDKYTEEFAEQAFSVLTELYGDKLGETPVKTVDDIYGLIEKPKDPSMGRFAFPVFRFAKVFKEAPPAIATKLSDGINDKLGKAGSIVTTPASGFINIKVDQAGFFSDTIKEVLAKDEKYGESDLGKGKTVLVEYSSPNIAKPFGVGHLRTTILGNSLRRIFKKLGYEVVGINYPGDWGTQFGKMLVAYFKWGTEGTLQGDVVKNLLDLYVKFHKEAESDPSLDDQAREAFQKLESGDKEYLELWKKFKEISYKEFKRVYDFMGVEFDLVVGESFYNEMMNDFIDRLDRLSLTKISKGALIVELDDENIPPALLRKEDGATLYLTRDLTGAIWRWEKYKFDQSLYVVATNQDVHFKQCVQVLEKLEKAEDVAEENRMAHRIKHVDFGLIKFGQKKLATRAGNIIFLEDVFNKAIELVKDTIIEKNPDLKDIDNTAKMVGIGAVFYSQFSVRRQKDVNFVWEDVLSFEGESGPYLQYTHARLSALLRNYGKEVSSEFDVSYLLAEEENRIIELLADFGDVVEDAGKHYEPFLIVQYLLKLCSNFNKLYQRKDENGRIDRILSDNEELTKARMALVNAIRIVIADGLYLLGIEAPHEM